MKLLALAPVLLGLLAGCGGSSSGASDTSPQSGTQILSCLQERYPSASDSEHLDYIAQEAGDKGIAIDFPRNRVTIAVERSESDAKHTLQTYESFLPSGAGTDQLTRIGTAVVAFDKTPTAEEFGSIKACVQDA